MLGSLKRVACFTKHLHIRKLLYFFVPSELIHFFLKMVDTFSFYFFCIFFCDKWKPVGRGKQSSCGTESRRGEDQHPWAESMGLGLFGRKGRERKKREKHRFFYFIYLIFWDAMASQLFFTFFISAGGNLLYGEAVARGTFFLGFFFFWKTTL